MAMRSDKATLARYTAALEAIASPGCLRHQPHTTCLDNADPTPCPPCQATHTLTTP